MGCSSGSIANRTVATKAEETRLTPVKTVAVAATEVQRTTTQPASVHAYYRAEIRPQSSGYVGELRADMGDVVEAGAVLATIEVPELKKQREIIESRIRGMLAAEQQAGAGINLAQARVNSFKAMLAEAESQMASAQAAWAGADAEFNRTQDLVSRGSLQNRMLDEVRMKRDTESARKIATSSSIDSAQAEVAVARAQATAAEAELAAAAAHTEIARRELEEIDVLIDFATIRAPFAGIVTERNIELGDLVSSHDSGNATAPMFVVSQTDRVRVRIPIPETDAPLIMPDDSVTLTFPSFSAEAPIVGTISRRSGNLDPNTRTMMVEVDLDNADGKLLPGMFGQATIQMASKVAANTLPSQAIRFDESGKAFVYIVSDQSTVSVAEVETGLDDGNTIQVLSGVAAGQRVIGSHLKRFSEGQSVAVLGSNQ